MHFYHILGTKMEFYPLFWHFFLKKTMNFPDLQKLSRKQCYHAINLFTSLVSGVCTALHCSALMWRTEKYRFQLAFTSSYANEDQMRTVMSACGPKSALRISMEAVKRR